MKAFLFNLITNINNHKMDPDTIVAFQEVLREILAALANCATRLQRLEKISDYYVMYITEHGREFIMHYGHRLREILKDRIATYRIQFSQDYARTNAEQAVEDWLLNILTEVETVVLELDRGSAPTTQTMGSAPTTPIKGSAPTTPTASGAGTSGAGTSGAGTSGIAYIITPPPLTDIIITQPNIIIEPINQTILQL